MKKLLILGLVLLASAVSAQSFVVSPFVGYSNMPSFGYFEYDEIDAGTGLIGLETGILFWDKLELGLELVYPFGYEYKNSTIQLTYKNTQIGAYGKYYFKTKYFRPYFKSGLAYYWGDSTFEPKNPNLITPAGDYPIDGNWGVNVGGGILLNFGLFAQFDYNFVKRKDPDWGKTFDMNTCDVRVGYQFSFGY